MGAPARVLRVAPSRPLRARAAVRAKSLPSEQVAEVQRSRLLAAAAAAVQEHGYPDATVGRITSRARISRRTFYELFDNREDCLLAVIADALERVEREVALAAIEGASWRDRLRSGLWAILSFFDREPALAQLCVVQAARGGERVQALRGQAFARLEAAIDEGRQESVRGADAPALSAEGLVGAAYTIVYERLLKGHHESLTGLLGDLMGMIVLPYLGPKAARDEQERPAFVPTGALIASDADGPAAPASVDPLEGIPIRLTYRTLRVLGCIADEPGISNRKVSERAEISDQGQASKLLSRLERLGLACNTGRGHTKGEPNAWHLTETGERIARTLGSNIGNDREAA